MPRNRSEWKYVVDPEYAEQVCSHPWCSNGAGYLLCRRTEGRRGLYMHRLVWQLANREQPPDGMEIDHINRIPWDNRLENLRVTTKSGNNFNTRRSKPSGLPNGVYLHRGRGRPRPYYSQITKAGKKRHLGSHATPEEASAVYERARAEAIADEETKACQSTVKR